MSNPLDRYAAHLYSRIDEAVVLSCADVGIGNWVPEHNECHINVTTFCEHQPDYSLVRGWLFFDLGGTSDKVKFLADSVVRSQDGTLYDITPSRASQQYPFVSADESEKEYRELVEKEGVIELWHTK